VSKTSGRSGDGVHVALQSGAQALHIAMNFARHHFKYVSYAVVTGNRLAIDLWKSAPPAFSAVIRKAPDGCLGFSHWSVRAGKVTATGTGHGIFENTLQVAVRGASGTIRGRPGIVVTSGGRWSVTVPYSASHRQAGTLEAVALSPKDGALDCIAQVRVTLPAS